MMKARIICKTDIYHASRDSRFARHSGSRVVNEYDSLKEANEALLGMFNDFAGEEGKYFPNWGLAVSWKGSHISLNAVRTFGDGTRAFNYDVYRYYTEWEI